MKLNALLISLPLVLAITSCAPTQRQAPPAPPVLLSRPAPSLPKPSRNFNQTQKKEEPVSAPNPLTPDPLKVIEKPAIPKFEVPENIQPKVSDGIDQSEFIELKWTVR